MEDLLFDFVHRSLLRPHGLLYPQLAPHMPSCMHDVGVRTIIRSANCLYHPGRWLAVTRYSGW